MPVRDLRSNVNALHVLMTATLRARNACLRWVDGEVLCWLLALVALAVADPQTSPHFTLFWPSWFFDVRSPGYNLGHSVSYLLHGDIRSSLDAHWLGIPTALVLAHRIFFLTRQKILLNEGGLKLWRMP